MICRQQTGASFSSFPAITCCVVLVCDAVIPTRGSTTWPPAVKAAGNRSTRRQTHGGPSE